MRIAGIIVVAALASCAPQNGTDGNGGTGGSGGSGGAVGNGAGGGGGGSAAPATQQNGSRIKMRMVTTPDGLRSPTGVRDVQLGVDCGFNQSADGQTRCLPLSSAYVSDVYGDPDCNNLIALLPCQEATVGAPPAYAYRTDAASNSCGSSGGMHVYPVTGVYSGTTYVISSNGQCQQGVPITSGGSMFLSLGSELPPSTFVAGTYVTE